jgi:hypothetical protein
MVDDQRLPESFWSKVSLESNTGCWVWNASTTVTGYGNYWDRKLKKLQLAHRYAYRVLVGTIPEGMTVDHLCKTRRCVNPEHFEIVSRGENTIRGGGTHKAAKLRSQKQRCKHGHPFDEDNTYVNPQGKRECRTCNRHRNKKSRLRR